MRFSNPLIELSKMIIQVISKYCPEAFYTDDVIRLTDTNNDIKITLSATTIDHHIITYKFRTIINGRIYVNSITINEMELEYFRDHADVFQEWITRSLGELFLKSTIIPIVEQNIKKISNTKIQFHREYDKKLKIN